MHTGTLPPSYGTYVALRESVPHIGAADSDSIEEHFNSDLDDPAIMVETARERRLVKCERCLCS